jgi:hypothetical protein
VSRGLSLPVGGDTLGSMARYKTGDTAPRTGTYDFDGYVDGTKSPTPTVEEQRIPLSIGETFPPVRSAKKAAYWRG